MNTKDLYNAETFLTTDEVDVEELSDEEIFNMLAALDLVIEEMQKQNFNDIYSDATNRGCFIVPTSTSIH